MKPGIMISKHDRLYAAFVKEIQTHHYSNNIVVLYNSILIRPDMWESNYILEVDYIRKVPESIQGPIFYLRVLQAAIVDNMRSMIIKDLYVLFVSVEIVKEIFSSLR